MDIQMTLIIGILTILPYLFINVQLSKEVLQWEPSLGKRTLLLLIIWCIPFLGAVFANKNLGLNQFKEKNKTSASEQGIASGLLELDAIFNPGTRHIIEAKKKEETRVELSEDGQLLTGTRKKLELPKGG